MTISKKIKSYLEKEKVSFEIAEHPLAYTASEIAQSQHVPGKHMVKVVIVKDGGKFLMCVLPSTELIDFAKLERVLGTKSVVLANESELGKLFPDYEVGAEPPFGHLYGLGVIADKALEEISEIVFNAGTHTDVIKMNFSDYKKLANPKVADIGTHI